MPVSKNFAHYPKIFRDIELYILEHLYDGPTGPQVPLDCGTKAAAFHLRLRFYGWRKIRMEQGASPTLEAVSVRFQEPSTLIFEAHQELPELEAQLRALGVPSAVDQLAKESLERFMANMGDIPQAGTAPEVKPETKHETQDDVLRRMGYFK